MLNDFILFFLHKVIKKLIKDHTREAADNADILRDKISALEIENKRLKHRVVVLFRALKEVLSRRRNQEVWLLVYLTRDFKKNWHLHTMPLISQRGK